MKLLADPENYYDVEIDVYGGGTNNPTYEISISDESDDGIPPLVKRINDLIDRGFRFTSFKLDGDSIGWKYFEMKMQLKDPLPPKTGAPHINPKTGKNYNWK